MSRLKRKKRKRLPAVDEVPHESLVNRQSATGFPHGSSMVTKADICLSTDSASRRVSQTDESDATCFTKRPGPNSSPTNEEDFTEVSQRVCRDEGQSDDEFLVFWRPFSSVGPCTNESDLIVGGFEMAPQWKRRSTLKRSRKKPRVSNAQGDNVPMHRHEVSSEAVHVDPKTTSGVACGSEPPSPPCSPPESPPEVGRDTSGVCHEKASAPQISGKSDIYTSTTRTGALLASESKFSRAGVLIENSHSGELSLSPTRKVSSERREVESSSREEGNGIRWLRSITKSSQQVSEDGKGSSGFSFFDSLHASREPGSPFYYGDLRTTYHVRSFDMVLVHVLSRFSRLLQEADLRLARHVLTGISTNAKSLFVRLYRRRDGWIDEASLRVAYEDINVACAVRELVRYRLLESTSSVRGSCGVCERLSVARQVVQGLNLDEMRALCSVIPGGKTLRRLTRSVLLPELLDVLNSRNQDVDRSSVTASVGARERNGSWQMTIDGSNPSINLGRAVLSADRVYLTSAVRRRLQRIHFLFFFEDGHDSPWVALAETSRVRFPMYECIYASDVFPSRQAFEDFEAARSIDLTTQNCVENKVWDLALHYGSVAEVEVREFLAKKGRWLESKASRPDIRCDSSLVHECEFPRSQARDDGYFREIEEQLKHPFFRRFSAVWKYASAAWRSVRALEALREYDTAVQRLEMLLSSGLLCTKRAKMVDRLTINLMHLGRDHRALDVICESVTSESLLFRRGILSSLAKRGVLAHSRILRRQRSTPDEFGLEADGGTISETIPMEISVLLSTLGKSIPVRKFRGRALPSSEIRDAPEPDTEGCNAERPAGVKSRFLGLREASLDVSVEELALEWYMAFDGWSGRHCEGDVYRFIWCLLMWDCVYAPVPDVFQTPFQVAPWDIGTESFYQSRKAIIDSRLEEIRKMSASDLGDCLQSLYSSENHLGVLCIGQAWDIYSVEIVVCIACGTGPGPIARICELLCKDYAYWSGGFPDLVLWKGGADECSTHCLPRVKLVEVKSQRDVLSERQRAWLSELLDAGVDCEVFKVVERETSRNSHLLVKSDLDTAQLSYLELEAQNDMDRDSVVE